MRRFNFMIDPELDELLEARARREGVSRGAVIRRLLRRELTPLDDDPLWAWIGSGEGGSPDDSLRVNEVVYGLDREP